MNKPLLTTGQWKCLLVVIFLYAASLNVWSKFYWERVAIPGVAGTLPVSVSSPDRNYRLPILTLDPRSALALAGAKPGDSLVFDRAGDVQRAMAAGETIGVTWYTKDQPHHVT